MNKNDPVPFNFNNVSFQYDLLIYMLKIGLK